MVRGVAMCMLLVAENTSVKNHDRRRQLADFFADDKLEYFHDRVKIWAVHDEAVRTIRRDIGEVCKQVRPARLYI